MNSTRHPQPLLQQLATIFQIELRNFRWSWRPMVITGITGPVILIVLMGFFAGQGERDQLGYVLSGNVVIALMFTNMGRMSSRFSFMKAVGTLDYYATLPIHRYLVVVAVLLAFFLLSLPAVAATIIFGMLFLGLPVALHPALLLAVPCSALSLAALGAYIGVNTRSLEEANTYNNLVLFVFMILGPVLIPPENLPRIMRWLGWLSPATYASSALRQTLLGPATARLWLDLGVMAAFALVMFAVVDRHMDWRER